MAQSPRHNCDKEVSEVVIECTDILEKADEVIRVKDLQISTQKAIIDDYARTNQVLIEKVNDLSVWYRKPEVIAPFFLTLGMVLATYAAAH